MLAENMIRLIWKNRYMDDFVVEDAPGVRLSM